MPRRNGNSSDETTVRIKRSTLARLRAAAQQLARAVDVGTVRGVHVDAEPINPECCGLSMNAMLILLLDARDAHQRRAREQREARRKRMPGVEGEV